MPARMTFAVWSRGFKNMLICLMGVVAFVGGLAFAISAIFEQTRRESLTTAFWIFWILIFAVFVFGWLYGKNGGGAVLLDCGPHPARILFLICAVLIMFMAAGDSFFGKSGIVSTLVGITFAVYWAIMAFGRLQVREHGIWQYCGLLKWHKIQSYRWEGETAPTLMLQTKTKFLFLGRGALPVPVEQKDAVDELLKKYASSPEFVGRFRPWGRKLFPGNTLRRSRR